uniref:Beta/gamma crystallin 'Greek key' domain-containing protein n=1 Tax=Cyprinus carpio TaxID=7962 RepID=A0A8C1YMX8_CYPCA
MILVFDQEEFRGNWRLITKDCPSLERCGITEVRSCNVLSGVWDLYKDPDYSGDHYLLEEGEYRNLKVWSHGKSTTSAPAPARSLKCVPFKIQLYEEVNFEGRISEKTGNCPSLDHFIQGKNVMLFSLLFSETDKNKLYCINNNSGVMIYFLSNKCLLYLEH